MRHKFAFALLLAFPLHHASTMIYSDIRFFVFAEWFAGDVIALDPLSVTRTEGRHVIPDVVGLHEVLVKFRTVNASGEKSLAISGDKLGFKSYKSLDAAQSAIQASTLIGSKISAWCATSEYAGQCRLSRVPRAETLLFGGVVFFAFLVLIHSFFQSASLRT